MDFKHFSTAEELSPQIHDKSFKPEHLESCSTLETQANKQAGGVAKTVVATEAKATSVVNLNIIIAIGV